MCALLSVVSISIMSELKMKHFITFCIMHMLTFFAHVQNYQNEVQC